MNKIRFRYVFLLGAFLDVFGLIYGGLFAFPSPDHPPAPVNVMISFWSSSIGFVLIVIASIGGLTRALFNHFSTSLSALLVGIFLVFSGYLYGVQFAFPLPNPPPDGLGWTFHVFASVAIFLVGLILVIRVSLVRLYRLWVKSS